MTIRPRGITIGAGVGLGTLLAAPAVAQADDFRVTNLDDSGAGSLRQAVEAADANPGADRILFRSKLSGEITLTDGVLGIGDAVRILGPGARRLTVSGNDASQVFNVFTLPGADVTISGMRLAEGNKFGSGGVSGGAIWSTANLTLSRVTIVGNSADGSGGGVATTPEADLTIEDSTISGNTAGDDGGGIYFSASGGGELEIRNSTISGNSADDDGGGVYLASTDAGSAAILNSTVTGNRAGDYAGGLADGFGDGATIRGSIVAGNTDGDGTVPDLDGGPWAISFSLIGDPTGAGIDDGGGNLLGVDPKLKPLKDNGGPTDTHAFKKSPAKNKIPKGETPKKDQRGAPRKGRGDIGAYELVKCKGVVVNRVGTAKKDKLKGTKRKDGILGLGGNDKLSGKKGKDGLCGGRGKDNLKGGPGKDKLDGGPGKDKEIQ